MDTLINIFRDVEIFIAIVVVIYFLFCMGVLISTRHERRRAGRQNQSVSHFLYLFFLIPMIAVVSFVAWPIFAGSAYGSYTSEAEDMLTSIATAQISYFSKNGVWAGTDYDVEVFSELDWKPSGRTHYAYYCGNDYILPKSKRYKFKYPEPGPDWPYAVEPEISLSDFVCVAVGNNDRDGFPDVWAINKNKKPVHLLDDSTDEMPVDVLSGLFDPKNVFTDTEDIKDELGISRVYIEINIPAYRLDLYYNEDYLRSYAVAVGRYRYKTPRRSFYMKRIEWNPWWYPPDAKWAANSRPARPGSRNPLGPVKMVLGSSILIHGTNKPESIGTSASHGCIRMFSDDAVDLAWKVMVLAGTKRPMARPRYYAARSRRTFRVHLQTTVRVRTIYQRLEISGDRLLVHPDPYRKQALKPNYVRETLTQNGFSMYTVDDEDMINISRRSYRGTIYIPISTSM